MSAPEPRQRSDDSGQREPEDRLVFEVAVRLTALPLDLIRTLLASVASAPASPAPSSQPPAEPAESDVQRLRLTLANLSTLPLAAILRELGAVLYNRDIRQWKVLTDVSDELIDQATLAARRRLTDQALEADKNRHKGPVKMTPNVPLADRKTLRKQRRSRSQWRRGTAKVVAAIAGFILLALVNSPNVAVAEVLDFVREMVDVGWLL